MLNPAKSTMDACRKKKATELPTTKIHLSVVIRPAGPSLAIFHHDRLTTRATLLFLAFLPCYFFFFFFIVGSPFYSVLSPSNPIKRRPDMPDMEKSGCFNFLQVLRSGRVNLKRSHFTRRFQMSSEVDQDDLILSNS